MAKILVVDDSQTQVQAIIKILNKNGHETITAEDGDSAVAVARDELPDLILMDVVMPGLNGFQATRHITKTEGTQHIPVIMLSSKDQETDKVWAERQGASGYIIKPASEDELMSAINKLL
ncbi:MAG: two-component system response regulator [endosymbiont of Galathealinum brachiosum]|uniref:Two-component system response regulator n=1 Tax=endosymbiont of Galathealinum brachiosum TaxID=2200906 RepID=A0A370DEM5_9GAMM|nr:MAG: two-component system response regulator [endosymbiont of Galathealinum brachiosum]